MDDCFIIVRFTSEQLAEKWLSSIGVAGAGNGSDPREP
jgi:hypothetical protein